MATTKIWPIKSGHLGKVIDYVSNSMKTDEHNFSAREIENLYNAIHYVEDATKTMNREKHIFVSGVNCGPSNEKNGMDTDERTLRKNRRHPRASRLAKLQAGRSYAGASA